MSWRLSRVARLGMLLVLAAGCSRESPAAVQQPDVSPETLTKQIKVHLSVVEVSNPRLTREMTERAGGRVDSCVACHVDLAEPAR